MNALAPSDSPVGPRRGIQPSLSPSSTAADARLGRGGRSESRCNWGLFALGLLLLAQGRTVKVTLEFEKAGKVELDFQVGSIGGRSAPDGEHHHH